MQLAFTPEKSARKAAAAAAESACGEEKLLRFCSEQVGIPAMITLSVVAAESIIRAICAGLQARSSLPHRPWNRDARAAVETRGDKDEESSEDAAQETRTAALYIYIYIYVCMYTQRTRRKREIYQLFVVVVVVVVFSVYIYMCNCTVARGSRTLWGGFHVIAGV